MGYHIRRLLQLSRQSHPCARSLDRPDLRFASPFLHNMRSRLISPNLGPAAGDPFPASADDTPPAVIPEFFNQVCPNPTIIDRDGVNGQLPGASAATLLQAWVNELQRLEDRCLEFRAGSWQVFDLWCAPSSPGSSAQPHLTLLREKAARRLDQTARYMAFPLHLASPDSLFLVTPHHRRACCECAYYPSRTLLRHRSFLYAFFQHGASHGSACATHPAWRLR